MGCIHSDFESKAYVSANDANEAEDHVCAHDAHEAEDQHLLSGVAFCCGGYTSNLVFEDADMRHPLHL